MNATPQAAINEEWHPLELFPFFRRWPASTVRDLIYTFIWNIGIASFIVLLTLLFSEVQHLGHFLWINFVMSNAVGYSIHGLFDLSGRLLLRKRIAQAPSWARNLYFISIPVCGVFIGYSIGFALLDMQTAMQWLFSMKGARSVALVSLIISAMLLAIFIAQARQSQNEAALATAKQQTLDAERRALEAQLRMLQAQIEPHFLYNTLANAVGLITPAPDKARLLLEKLIDYLRASLTSSRESQTELGREMVTLRAYLDLMTVRMGSRLTYHIDFDPAITHTPLPPMLLQPLVENAIQHGLEPKIEGGEIAISAKVQDGKLQIVIADTGSGFDPSAKPRAGGGVGLVNLRDRLASLYGGSGLLTIADNLPCGVKITLQLPLNPAP